LPYNENALGAWRFTMRIFIRTFIYFFILTASINVYGKAQYPAFELPELHSDNIIELNKLRGKVVYVDFWASWCGPCRQSMPKFNTLYKQLSSKGFDIVAINLDESKADAQRFLQDYPVNYTVLYDATGQSPKQFGVSVMPTGYLLDRFGMVRYTHQGFRDGDEAKLMQEVNKLLAE